jgi:hypothetical protein
MVIFRLLGFHMHACGAERVLAETRVPTHMPKQTGSMRHSVCTRLRWWRASMPAMNVPAVLTEHKKQDQTLLLSVLHTRQLQQQVPIFTIWLLTPCACTALETAAVSNTSCTQTHSMQNMQASVSCKHYPLACSAAAQLRTIRVSHYASLLDVQLVQDASH